MLRDGLAHAPRAAALDHALGLSLARQRRPAESLKALAEATRLAPDDARFAYVYAVAQADAGRTREALATLRAALARHPYDRDLLSSLAYYAGAAGERPAALGYAKTLVSLEPENPEFANLERGLEDAAAR